MAGHGGPLSWDGSEAKQLWQEAKFDHLSLNPPMAGHGWPLSWAGLEAKASPNIASHGQQLFN